MTIKQAFTQLQAAIPAATFISVEPSILWRPRSGFTTEYTVAVMAPGEHWQQSGVADLEGAVRTIIGDAIGPKASDLDAVDRELACMADIHGADELAELSNDQG